MSLCECQKMKQKHAMPATKNSKLHACQTCHCAMPRNASNYLDALHATPATKKSELHMHRVGQNRIHTYIYTVYLVISMPKIPYVHCIYMVLANRTCMHSCDLKLCRQLVPCYEVHGTGKVLTTSTHHTIDNIILNEHPSGLHRKTSTPPSYKISTHLYIHSPVYPHPLTCISTSTHLYIHIYSPLYPLTSTSTHLYIHSPLYPSTSISTNLYIHSPLYPHLLTSISTHLYIHIHSPLFPLPPPSHTHPPVHPCALCLLPLLL